MKKKYKLIFALLTLFLFVFFQMESKKINYSRLEFYLSKKDWEKADVETSKIMDKILLNAVDNQSFFGYSRFDFFGQSRFALLAKGKISCTYFEEIDKNWIKYSQGSYGFSSQSRILREIAKRNESNTNRLKELILFKFFKKEVGWNYSVNSKSKSFYNISENIKNNGYLPSYLWVEDNIKVPSSKIFLMPFLFNYQKCVSDKTS